MSRDRRLRQSQVSRQIDHPVVPKGKMPQNRQPCRIPETAKQTRRSTQRSRLINLRQLSNAIHRFHRLNTMLAATAASVGERISLSTMPLLLGLVTASWVKSVNWAIPGTVIKNWVATLDRGVATPLTSADTSGREISFHWVDGGLGRVVSAHCVIFSGVLRRDVSLTMQWTFDVKRPHLDYLRRTRDPKLRGKSRIGTNSASARKQRFLEFTGAERYRGIGIRRHSGIAWDWQVTMPGGIRGGDFKDFQTLHGFVHLTERKEGGGSRKSVWKRRTKDLIPFPGLDPPNGYLVVDALPDAKEVRYGTEYPITVEPGKSYGDLASGADAPDWLLSPSWTRLSINYLFEYWILFEPQTDGAIWVPIAKVQWRWKATALRKEGTWSVTDGGSGPVGSGGPTLEFPVYDGWADDETPQTGFEWFEVKE